MNFPFVYFKKVTNFAARYGEEVSNNNIKISIYNEKNVPTL